MERCWFDQVASKSLVLIALSFEQLASSMRDVPGEWQILSIADHSKDTEYLLEKLSRADIPRSIGILAFSFADSRADLIVKLSRLGFKASIIAIEDEHRSSDERQPIYKTLISLDYCFGGIEEKFSFWTRSDSTTWRPLAPLLQPPPGALQTEIAPACFDTPIKPECTSVSGRLELQVTGWAFVNGISPVSASVYVCVRNLGTDLVQYVLASRCSRPDVSLHFGNSDLVMSGFLAAIPMEGAQPSGLILSIVQSDRQKCWSSGAVLKVKSENRSFEQTVRRDLASKFLRGSGIEIGALQRKLDLPPTCKVRYVDRMTRGDLLSHYPELKEVPLQSPDVIADGEYLSAFAASSLDFVVANHFLEHSQNPIGTLQNLLRVLRPMGVLFMAVPDKHYTFDWQRPSTAFEDLRAAYESGARLNRNALYHEWVEVVEKVSVTKQDERVAELLNSDYSIHFNVWSTEDLLTFLLRARHDFSLPFRIISIVCSDNEVILILERDWDIARKADGDSTFLT